MRRKKHTDTISLFGARQSPLLEIEGVEVSSRESPQYPPSPSLWEENEALRMQIDSIRREWKDSRLRNRVFSHFYDRHRRLQDPSSEEFFRFVKGLGEDGKKITRALNLKNPKKVERGDQKQASLYEFVEPEKD